MFIAKKPCTFAGQSFLIGDTIPDNLIHHTAIPRLIKNGKIAEVGTAGLLLPASTSLEDTEVPVTILADEGEAIADVSLKALLEAVRAVQMDDEDLIAEIQTIESPEALMIIDLIRGIRCGENAIAEAVKARAEFLVPKEPEEDQHVTEEQLMEMKRDDLVALAKSYGYEAVKEDTKKILASKIMELQQVAGEE